MPYMSGGRAASPRHLTGSSIGRRPWSSWLGSPSPGACRRRPRERPCRESGRRRMANAWTTVDDDVVLGAGLDPRRAAGGGMHRDVPDRPAEAQRHEGGAPVAHESLRHYRYRGAADKVSLLDHLVELPGDLGQRAHNWSDRHGGRDPAGPARAERAGGGEFDEG